jgi:D-alanine-D-alanine ligase
MQVLILYNEPVLDLAHPDAQSEHEVLETVSIVRQHLIDGGLTVRQLAVQRDPNVLLTSLRRQPPDVVFNLFEGLADHYDTEAHVAGMLEWLGIPFTGCPYQTLCIARSKHLTKYLLQGAGLPTPAFRVVDELPVPDCSLGWPVIVKPAAQDASLGLDQGSVVTNQQQLNERVASVLKTFGAPVLVEEFIGGREFNVGLIEVPELQVLPIGEILFTDKDPNFWPIVTYDAKWKPGTRDYESTPPRFPAEVAPRQRERIGALAKKAFRLLGCRDYARVDFRLRPSGKPYILEVNPNPDFNPTAGLPSSLELAGMTHGQFTVDLVHAALTRGRASKKESAVAGIPVFADITADRPRPSRTRRAAQAGSNK